MLVHFVAALFLFVLPALQAEPPAEDTISSAKAVAAQPSSIATKNISYTSRAGTANRFNTLDVYHLSESDRHDEVRPVLVFIHGGGWSFGDKRAVNLLPDWCDANGWVLVSLNYRHSPQVQHPAHAQDVAVGVQWVFENIAEYGGNPDQVVLLGHSAGAHLAAIVASDPGLLGLYQRKPSDLAGVVLLDGAGYDITTQLESAATPASRRRMLENAFGTDKEKWIRASPMHWAAKPIVKPPLLAVHAGKRVASKVESEQLAKLWASNASRAEVHHAPRKTHGTVNREMGTTADPDTEAVKAFIRWAFEAALKPESTESSDTSKSVDAEIND